MKYITRFAPSPTGMMHIGSARTAYFNWLAARASGGKFILRIDDTDISRNDDANVNIIIEAMNWLGMDYDNIYYQSRRIAFYNLVINKMIKSDKAYINDDAVYLRVIDNDDIVLRRSNGMPTYHLASVVDDWMMDVNYIIRGTDHISNLPRHKYIWNTISSFCDKSLDFPKIDHVGLIRKDNKKLSKRDGASSILEYRDAGYVPEAMLNFLLRMGWGPHEDNKENSWLTREKSLQLFLNNGKLRKADANFDAHKLNWYQKKHGGTKINMFN